MQTTFVEIGSFLRFDKASHNDRLTGRGEEVDFINWQALEIEHTRLDQADLDVRDPGDCFPEFFLSVVEPGSVRKLKVVSEQIMYQ